MALTLQMLIDKLIELKGEVDDKIIEIDNLPDEEQIQLRGIRYELEAADEVFRRIKKYIQNNI